MCLCIMCLHACCHAREGVLDACRILRGTANAKISIMYVFMKIYRNNA